MKHLVLLSLYVIVLLSGLTSAAFAQGNQPPALQDPDDRWTTAGDEALIQLVGSDPDNDTLTYSATGLPPAVTANSTTGLISGTPTEAAAGTYTVVATVSDGSALFAEQTFTWTVIATAPGLVTLSAPTDTVSVRTPALVWDAEPGAEYYIVRVTERTQTTDTWVTPTAAGCTLGSGTCSKTLGHDLDVGLVKWQVLAWNSFGYGPWSVTQPFVVNIADAGAPQAVAQSPAGAIENEWTPFQWSRVASAVWYRLWRQDGADIELERWFKPADVGCVTAELCEATISPYLSDGAGEWKLQAWTTSGYGVWSDTQTFSVVLTAPATPQPSTPKTTLTDQTPTFTWAASAHAWYYLLRVYEGESYIDRWYTPAEAECSPGDQTCSVRPTQTLSAGLYDWQLLAWNPEGYSPWSFEVTFRIATTAPVQVVLDTPADDGTTHAVPSFVWQASPNATYYMLRINDSAETEYDRWYTPEQAGCPVGLGDCSASPVTLPGGPATWKVLVYNPIGYGPWSVMWSFVACAAGTTPSTISAPSAGQFGSVAVAVDPACAWTAASNAAWLHVTEGQSGSGEGEVAYTIEPNHRGTSRTATLTVDDVVISVSQAPLCIYGYTPTFLVFPAGGGTAAVSVTATAECAWTAVSGNAWLTIVSGGSGTGNGVTEYAATANPNSAMRQGLFGAAVPSNQVYQSGMTPDTTPPVVTATLSPPATAAGWNNGPTSVVFTCTDNTHVANCPEPVAVTQEGSGQAVTRVATDIFGNEASKTVTVNIDRTPAVVTIDSPADYEIETAASSVVVTGDVDDVLSGLLGVTCNGSEATVDGDTFTCSVPLTPGANSVVVHATDNSRNGTSVERRVLRTEPLESLAITPSTRSLLIGDAQPLVLVDQTGLRVDDAAWTSSDDQVATIELVEGSPVLVAHGQGQATITASVSSVSAEATVEVFSGSALPFGTTKWSNTSSFFWHTLPGDIGAGGPEQFAFSFDSDSGRNVAHALSGDGAELWAAPLPSLHVGQFADSLGGLVSIVVSQFGGPVGVSRVGGPTGGAWEYRATDVIAGPLAQNRHGTIYFLERGQLGLPTAYSMVALDGRTGAVKSKTQLPSLVTCAGDLRHEAYSPLSYTQPVIASDDSAYIGVGLRDVEWKEYYSGYPYWRTGCFDMDPVTTVHYYQNMSGVYLLRVDDAGASSTQVIRDFAHEFRACLAGYPCDEYSEPYVSDVRPSAQGLLVSGWDVDGSWTIHYNSGATSEWADASPSLDTLISEDDTSYSVESNEAGNYVVARDSNDGTTKWGVTLIVIMQRLAQPFEVARA